MSQVIFNHVLWNRVRWKISRWLKNIGMTGLAGVILVVFAVAGYLGAVLPQQARFERLRQDVAEEQARQQTALLSPAVDTRSTEARLHVFYEFFPAREKTPGLLKTIYRAARDEAITLAEGEYKYSHGKAGGIGMYQVDLPVKGSYVQIRRFIVKVLNSVPSAALDEVSFKREIVGSGELEARIRFTIYLGAD